MNLITKATQLPSESLEFKVTGKVVRVFDQNGAGDLLPVEYKQLEDHGKFTLIHHPHGQVFAEVNR